MTTEARNWIESTCKEVERLAVLNGWEVPGVTVGGGWDRAGTGSRYIEIFREDDDFNLQNIVIRVSDHGSAHCSEDISIAMNPSGDDHSLEVLAVALAQPFKAD